LIRKFNNIKGKKGDFFKKWDKLEERGKLIGYIERKI